MFASILWKILLEKAEELVTTIIKIFNRKGKLFNLSEKCSRTHSQFTV